MEKSQSTLSQTKRSVDSDGLSVQIDMMMVNPITFSRSNSIELSLREVIPQIKPKNTLESLKCPACGTAGQPITKRQAGLMAYFCCSVLFITAMPIFWLPFCFRGCKDTQILCQDCGQLKAIIKPTCC